MEGLRKNMKTSARRAGARAKIWTQDLPNTNHECQPLHRDISLSADLFTD
jgi:hypothetical protein